MDKLKALKLAYRILTDNTVSNKFCMTQLRDRKTLEVTSYSDAVKVIEDIYREIYSEEEAKQEVENVE